jgi:adenylosuccinate lyase
VWIGNVLANRYASAAMREVWSAENKIISERRLWLAVLAAQQDLGVDFGGDDPTVVMKAYQGVVEQVDLTSIAEREKITRHDVKARIEEFNALAGYQHVHKGMTSRDLTENVEQLQIASSLKIIRDRVVATLARLAQLATEYATQPMAGRTHNVAAQITTLGTNGWRSYSVAIRYAASRGRSGQVRTCSTYWTATRTGCRCLSSELLITWASRTSW